MTDIPAWYKQTEIGIIPNDWNVSNITNSFSMKARIWWQWLRTDEYLNNWNYYLITWQDFDNWKIWWDNCYYVDKKRYDQDKHIQIKPLDVLVTKDWTIGKVAFIDSMTKPATLNSWVFVLRTKNASVYQKFFYYLLSSFYFDNFMSQITAGSTIVHLYQKDFVKFDHIVPTYKEQKEIANALSDMDELISNLDKLIIKKKNIKESMVQKLLSPKDWWTEVKLKDVAKRVIVWLATSVTQHYREKWIPIFRNLNIKENYLDDSDILFLEDRYANSQTSKMIHTWDVLTVHTWYVWISCIVPEKYDNCLTFTTLITTLKEQEVDNKYFCYFCNSTRWLKRIENLTTQWWRQNLNSNDFINLEISIPPTLEEQKEIATILSDMDKEIEALEQKKIKYENIKIWAIQKLLTWKIRLV